MFVRRCVISCVARLSTARRMPRDERTCGQVRRRFAVFEIFVSGLTRVPVSHAVQYAPKHTPDGRQSKTRRGVEFKRRFRSVSLGQFVNTLSAFLRRTLAGSRDPPANSRCYFTVVIFFPVHASQPNIIIRVLPLTFSELNTTRLPFHG